jgi:hypothetical protein
MRRRRRLSATFVAETYEEQTSALRERLARMERKN